MFYESESEVEGRDLPFGEMVTCKHEWTIWRSWEVCDLCGEVK